MRVVTFATATTAAVLLLSSSAGAARWSDTAPATGFFGAEDLAYYQAELGVPVKVEPGLKLQLLYWTLY